MERSQLKISKIALQSDYDNQSKFAAVFKKEYRRMKRLEGVRVRNLYAAGVR